MFFADVLLRWITSAVVLSVVSPFPWSPVLFSFKLLLSFFAFVQLVEYDARSDELEAAEDDHRLDLIAKDWFERKFEGRWKASLSNVEWDGQNLLDVLVVRMAKI
jgi:hypothetical protein